jgi:hypothetical protein
MQCNFSLNNLDVRLNLQSWSWCLRCCSVVVSSKGMHKVEQNYTHTHTQKKKKKSPTKCPQFKCNTVSVSFSACKCNSVVLSSKVGRKRKKASGGSSESGICNCGLPACCFQPVAGGIIYADLWGELALTWSHRLCLLRVLLCGGLCHRLSPFQALGKVTLPHVVRPACLFTAHLGSGSSLLSQASPLLVAGHAPLQAEPLWSARLVYLQSWEGFPSPNLQRSGCPTLFPAF